MTNMEPLTRQNTRVNQTEVHMIRQVVNELLNSPAPMPAIARFTNNASSPNVSPFERYAGLVLKDSGAHELARRAPGKTVKLLPPEDGHLARLVLAGPSPEENQLLAACTEAAINRLCCIADALEDSGESPETPHRKITISLLGGGYKPEKPGYRSAHITLPEIGRSERPKIPYLNEVDWRVLEHVAIIARTMFQRSILPNMHQGFMGAYGSAGSDWDIRTRIASALEKLELPFRFPYRFDCNVSRKATVVGFELPQATCFPQRTTQPQGGLQPCTDKLDSALMAYALRLACLLAAVCFGAGSKIESTWIIGRKDDREVLHCRFDRMDFVYHTLANIDSGALSNPALRFKPLEIAPIAAPSALWLDCGLPEKPWQESTGVPASRSNGHDIPVLELNTNSEPVPDVPEAEAENTPEPWKKPIQPYPNDNRIPAHLDTRPLPDAMEQLFHASRICDIDTLHAFGSSEESIEEARLESDSSVIAAIANLEQLVDTTEVLAVPPEDDASARPLFCANPLERATISLYDDEFAVSLHAENFMHGNAVDYTETPALPHYFRAPDALFQARLGLADLYNRIGETWGAELQADRCLALGPTSAQAHYQKANILANQGRYEEAANTLVAGLRTVVSERDCALLYYHLALVLGKLGRESEATAVYVYTTSLAGEYAKKALTMVASLRKKDKVPVIAHASPLAASREMARARIPVAPTDEARTLIVHAAVGLSCANAPVAAAPYAAAIARFFRNDAVIAATAFSLQRGMSWQ